MLSLPSGLRGSLVLLMLSHLVTRGFCQVVAEVTSRSCPTFAPLFQAFTTSSVRGEATDGASVVSNSQLKTMLSNRDIQLFDVRNPDEYVAGHIPDAVNIPLGNLEQSLKLSSDHFLQRFKVKPPGRDDANIVFYCKSGNRSSKALDIARQLGFLRARHYRGGYSEWAEQGGK